TPPPQPLPCGEGSRGASRPVHRRKEPPVAEFTLPKNSRISRKGRTYRPEEGKRLKHFKIYRYDPETSANPRYDTYTIDLDKCGPTVLEAPIYIDDNID